MDRNHLISAAAKKWSTDLLDRSGRNPLLYYRDLRRGTLDLTEGRGVSMTAQSKLLNSKKVRLSNLFTDQDQLKDASRRARTIAAKARENDEERGVQTLFIAWGSATWTDHRTTGPGSSSTPSAPVLLSPLSLNPRGAAAEDFQLQASEEWELNPTLLHHLESQYEYKFSEDEQDKYHIEEYRVALADRLTEQSKHNIPDFTINRARLVIGNFSYKKLAMVKDIEEASKNGFLAKHDLLAAIAGNVDARALVRDQHINSEPRNPDDFKPSEEFLILDADASQSNVINTILSGRDLVVEGPPGTGKSQTIANLIAALVAQQKRVLFVAEKRAAIDAVLKRLKDTGLSDIVLDLHVTGAKSIRRRVANEISQTLGRFTNSEHLQVENLHRDLIRYRDQLNKQTKSFHQERNPWDESVYSIQTNLIDLKEKVQPSIIRLAPELLESLTGDQALRMMNDLKRYVDLDGLSLVSKSNPWTETYSQKTLTTKEQIRDSLESLEHLNDYLDHSIEQWREVALQLDISKTVNIIQRCQNIVDLIKRIENSCQYINPAAYNTDLGELRRVKKSKLIYRLLSKNYRQAINNFKTLWLQETKPTKRALKRLGKDILDIHSEWKRITCGKQLQLSPEFPLALSGKEIENILNNIADRIKRVGDPVLHTLELDNLSERIKILLNNQQTLFNLVDIYQLEERLPSSDSIDQIIREATRRQLNSDQTVDLFRYILYKNLFDHIRIEDPSIRTFKGAVLNRTIAQYKQVDRQHIKSGRTRVLRRVAESSVAARNEYPDEALVVQKQANLKRGHLTIRQLLDKAPNVLLALKPCWAMSPLLVAESLPQEQLFDVVIFDEASQVTAADAVGPIMRAKKVVVTGDTKQLPPTRFFLGYFEEEDEDTEEEVPALTSGFESILDLMATLLPPPHGTRYLNWHYRSRNERLIAFSNSQSSLYDGSLTTFPGTNNTDCIKHVLTDYDPGGTGKQKQEATHIIELIQNHVRRRPEESLGIITMGIKHAELIEELLRQYRQSDPELNDWIENGPESKSDNEALFIKNIERVQGDERDAIILSIGYGRNPNGRMRHQFGPLNTDGGERRLNVAVTRARRRMTIVSSFTSHDLDPSKLRSEGAKMLSRYLAYAESGGADLGRDQQNTVPLNPFERDIQNGLEEAGIPLTPQYGSAGYWIDFAARHPEQPGRMVLAIEADGARYHSSKTARDRDRLRQEHLERIGWRFHRIWSTDWFLNREQEINRTVAAWKCAVADADNPNQTVGFQSNISESGLEYPDLKKISQRKGNRPVQPGLLIQEYPYESLVDLIHWIKSDGKLLTDQELLDIAVKELGFKRKGSRIVATLKRAIIDAKKGNG